MSKRTSVVNISGDHEETLIQLAKHLGTNKIRRKIFYAIYGRGTKTRSKKQIMDAAGIPENGTNAQQAQNELDHLAKHHLIVRSDNDGSVKDGSRNLYGKDETVRANKPKIIRWADNRKAADQVPTKRRPVNQGVTPLRKVTRKALKKQKNLSVLYLTANPDPNDSLRVDAEVRGVQEAIRSSLFRDNIEVEYRPAADLKSIIDGLNDHRPQIVHFSGHGYDGGIATDTGKVDQPTVEDLSFELLAKALSATDSPPEIVVLNSCESSGAKKALLPPAKILISMQTTISDIAATAFATHFYAAIASGQSVKAAFAQGKIAVEVVSISEFDTPELLHTSATNPAKIILT